MLSYFRNRKGQNTAEYALLLGLVVSAAIAMQTYVKRNLQGGVKYAVDRGLAKDAASITNGDNQYEPYYLQSDYQTTVGDHTDTEMTSSGGGVSRTFASDTQKKQTTRSGYQKTKSINEAD